MFKVEVILLLPPKRQANVALFNLSLHYERGFTKGYEQYNGNLSGQTWRGRDGVQRAYGYVYDPLSRLLQNDFVARITTAHTTPMAETNGNGKSRHLAPIGS